MVYCTKCGTNNKEDADWCIKCGANLTQPSWTGKRGRKEEECFGLPHGGVIVGLIIGIIIILVGISSLAGWDLSQYFWPFIIIVFGILIVAGAAYSYTRRY